MFRRNFDFIAIVLALAGMAALEKAPRPRLAPDQFANFGVAKASMEIDRDQLEVERCQLEIQRAMREFKRMGPVREHVRADMENLKRELERERFHFRNQ